MRLALIAAVVALGFAPQAAGPAQTPAGPKVKITFEEGGLVTLVANEASVREILAEWERQGGSKFVNAERLTNVKPVTMQFTHQRESDVMASLLRQAAGYLLGPRRAGTVGASSFEVVYILPTSNPSTSTYVPPATSSFQQPMVSSPGNPDDELPPVGRGTPPPGPQPNQPQPTPSPSPYPGSGVSGVAVPVVPIVPVNSNPPPPPNTGRGSSSGS